MSPTVAQRLAEIDAEIAKRLYGRGNRYAVAYQVLRAALAAALAEAEQANKQRARLWTVLQEARNTFSRIDNGTCRICGGHRIYNRKLSAVPSQCENELCFSHVMDKALTAAQPPQGGP